MGEHGGKKNSHFGVALVLFICLGLSAHAQLPTATISGVVKDATGAAIPGVAVTVTNVATGLTRPAKTSEDGSYRFSALPVGTYDIRAEQPGFQTKVEQGLRVAVGDEAVLNIVLAVGAVADTVSVTAEAPIVNTTSGTLGSLVSERTVSDLPLNGRNFNDLTLLQTGVAENRAASTAGTLNGIQFSSNGAPTRSNLFTIDGTIMNDLHNTGASSSNENSLGVEGIREYRVVTNSFSAEYGMNMGSQVTLVTKSGTNELHGSVFHFLRNSALDAFRRNNFGFSLGGPVRSDKLFYFGTYEGLRQARTTTELYTIPSLAARQDAGLVPAIAPSVKPYLGFWPAPNGEDLGGGLARFSRANTERQSEDYGQVRADYNVTNSDSLFGRYTITNSNDLKEGMIDAVFSEFPTRNQYVTLSQSHIFTPGLLGTLRGSFSRTHSTATSTIDLPANLSFTPGQPMGGLGITGVDGYSTAPGTTPVEVNQRIISASGDIFYTLRQHSLKFGTLLNFYRQFMSNNGGNSPRGNWTFPNLATFLTAAPTQFTVLTPGSSANRTYDYETVGLYLQDDWRATPTLTLNLGLRYEMATTPVEIHGDGAAVRDIIHDSAVTIGAPFINPSKKNFSPRFGFAWDIGGHGRTSIRGGAGLLYDVGIFGTALFIGASATPPLSSVSNLTPAQGLVFRPFPPIPPELAGRELRTVDYHLQQPHLFSYNLTLERQLPGQIGLTVAYAGSRGMNIMQTKEGNPTIPLGVVRGGICDSRVPTPPASNSGPKCWRGSGATDANPAGSATGIDPRLNPAWNTVEFKTAGADSWYDSLQFTVVRRFSRGFQFQSSYTWGHALDTTQSQIGVDNSVTSNNFGDDPSDPNHDKGSAGFDQRHGWRVNGIYRFPSNLSGAWGKLANGWWISSILTWNSGFPFDPNSSTQRSRSLTGGTNGGQRRGDLVPGIKHENLTRGGSVGCTLGTGSTARVIASGTPLGTPELFYDPCALALPNPGFNGNAGRSMMYGPNYSTLNLSVVKDTPLPWFGENGAVQFRTEIFNLLNHPSLGVPSRTFNLTTAGQITSTFSRSREIQFALKILF
ncbi:MAG: hypothetical protein DMG13_27330 [Acidobacteria bacterium]|nr:MAG: hypothetical protein DMG13_27330 [Acidobacteriota bacterium]